MLFRWRVVRNGAQQPMSLSRAMSIECAVARSYERQNYENNLGKRGDPCTPQVRQPNKNEQAQY